MSLQRVDKQDIEKFLVAASAGGNCTVAITTGAANVATFTVQFMDAGVKMIDVYMSTSNVGAGVTGTTYSTGLAVTTGTLISTLIAAKSLTVLTDATGKAVFSLTATAKPQGEYMCVCGGGGGGINMSAATVTANYG